MSKGNKDLLLLVDALAREKNVPKDIVFTALESDPAARDAAAKQFTQLLTARGLACTASQPVGRFDTPAMIKARGGNKQCFTKQDAVLGDWLGAV